VKVLIAHPSDSTRSKARAVLERSFYDVAEVGAARDVVAACRSEEPAVLLLASELRDSARPDPLAALRDESELARISVVLVDAPFDVDAVLTALRDGAHDVLRDIGDTAELLARAHSAGRVNELRQMLRRWADDLPELAFTDEVTRLYNRKYLVRQLSALIASARRHHRELAIALFDVDRFKRINDTFGHAAGDAVLSRLAELVRAQIRQEDLSGRYGGDEFLLILPDSDAAGAQATCEKLRDAVAAASPDSLGYDISLTASIGWASWHGEELDELIARADESLYRAKRAGRDRVCGPLPPGS
jgi:diguanylate cyclase (GGDEF)-like protein